MAIDEKSLEDFGKLRGKIDISRRGFLKNAGVVVAGAAGAAALAGCSSPKTASSDKSEGGSSANASSGASAYAGNEGKTMGEVLGAGWLGEEPEIAASDIAETKTCDIVVCGAGHAGTATARRAAEKGANVIVVETQTEADFAVLGNDIGHLNSSWQTERHGIPSYDVVDFMNEYQICGAGRVEPTLLSDFANRSGEAFDWFIDNFTEEEKAQIVPLNWPVPDGYDYKKGMFHSYVGTANFGEGVSLKDALIRSQDIAKEAGVEFLYETTGVKLVHNDDNTEVTGIICQQGDKYVEIDAKAVVLCCGDIGSNSEMYNAICAENYWLGEFTDCKAMSGRDGSGIAMAMRMGAKVEIGTGGDMGSHAAFPMSPLEACETIWLNKYGKRFCNEGLGGPLMSGCTPARQPGDILYSIWDADWKPMLLNQIAGHLALKYWDDDTINKIDGYMQAAEQAGKDGSDESGKYLYCADTIEELCDYMGMEDGVKKQVVAAVADWNAAIEAGADMKFGRDVSTMYPIIKTPFYGFAGSKRVGGGSLVSTSGLLVTGDQQVQGQGFEPIKGLYACGNTEGGRFPMGYNGIMNGVSIGMCLTLGYTLGEFLATGDLDEATTLGLNNAEPKQSDKGMPGPPPAA